MMRSKNFIFSGRVMMISRLVRSSATILTLPRMMPRSAISMISATEALGAVLARMIPGTVGRTMPGWPELLARGADDFFCSACWSAMISSSFCLISEAFALWMMTMMGSSRASTGWSM